MTERDHRAATIGVEPTYVSPGGSAEIRMLLQRPEGELTHARCPAGRCSEAAAVSGTSEMFFVMAGRGVLWRKHDDREDVVELRPGRAALIPAGTTYQFRSGPKADLTFMVATLPMWVHENWHAADESAWPAGASEGPLPGASRAPCWPVEDLRRTPDYFAPDGSEIRLLTGTPQGGLSHCTLHPAQASGPVRHKTVAELWFTLAGQGEIWRRDRDDVESVCELRYGVTIEISPGTAFQFQSTGGSPLELLLLTMPAWPGAGEAEPAGPGRWSQLP
jgi:mannose-6-phosphate isomerase-like protein (cupin superfamily)